MSARPPICAAEGCDTILSRFNTRSVCAPCDAARETLAAIARVPAPLPPIREAAASPCRIPGCAKAAEHNVGSRGMYANLCGQHYQQRCDEFSAHRKALNKTKPGPKKGERVNGRPAPPLVEGTRAQLAAEIAQIAKQMDAIDAERMTLRARERPLIDRWTDLIRAMSAYDSGPS